MCLKHKSTTFKGAATFRRPLLSGGRYFRGGATFGDAIFGGLFSENFRSVTNLTLLSEGRYFRGAVTFGILRYVLRIPCSLSSMLSSV